MNVCVVQLDAAVRLYVCASKCRERCEHADERTAYRIKTVNVIKAKATQMEFAIHFECTSGFYQIFRILHFERNYGGE